MKRGEDSGYVKLSLRGYSSEEQITVLRIINTQNKSEWQLNGIQQYLFLSIFCFQF